MEKSLVQQWELPERGFKGCHYDVRILGLGKSDEEARKHWTVGIQTLGDYLRKVDESRTIQVD